MVAAIDDDQLSLPTPSADYTVGDLIDHVDGLSVGLRFTAEKSSPPIDAEPPRDGDAALLADGWRERIPTQLADLASAWSMPDAWRGDTAAGGVPLEAAAAGMFALDEIIVHGWELAVASGQTYPLDDDAAVLAVADFLADQPRSSDLFGPVVDVAADDTPLRRLVGLTGRDPDWIPPTNP